MPVALRSVWPDPVRHVWRAVFVLGLLVWCGLALAQGLTFPALSGRVVDAANILSPDARARIDEKLKAHDDKTSDQIVVATVPSLGGTSIEDYANQLFRHWKLGQAKTNNGILLLVAPNERKVRIEVGYGLEGTLTDATASMIIQAAITPKFKQGDFAGGLEAGAAAIISTLQGDNEWQQRVKLRNNSFSDSFDQSILMLLGIIVFIFLLDVAQTRSGGGTMHRRRGGQWTGSRGGFGGGFGGGSSSSGGGFSGGGGSSGGGGASGSW